MKRVDLLRGDGTAAANGPWGRGAPAAQPPFDEVAFKKHDKELDEKAERVADMVSANEPERETIRRISKLVRYGSRIMDLKFRSNGQEHNFQADWIARLFR